MGELAGRNLWSIPVPAPIAVASGRAADWARVRFKINPALSYEPPWLIANGDIADSSAAIEDLGTEFTELDMSLSDTVRWLHAAGPLSGREAGALAS